MLHSIVITSDHSWLDSDLDHPFRSYKDKDGNPFPNYKAYRKASEKDETLPYICGYRDDAHEIDNLAKEIATTAVTSIDNIIQVVHDCSGVVGEEHEFFTEIIVYMPEEKAVEIVNDLNTKFPHSRGPLVTLKEVDTVTLEFHASCFTQNALNYVQSLKKSCKFMSTPIAIPGIVNDKLEVVCHKVVFTKVLTNFTMNKGEIETVPGIAGMPGLTFIVYGHEGRFLGIM